MKKSLVVSYTPRNESNTQKLLDTFFQINPDRDNTEHLDLVTNPPPFLLKENLNALLKRNYMRASLSTEEQKSLQNIDVLLKQFLDVDRIVIGFPMYNFSLPAAVKAWIDSIVQLDRTFKLNDDGSYEGLCQDKKALFLMTTGADYHAEPYRSMNLASPLIEVCFSFMGIETHSISAFGLDQYPERAGEIVGQAQEEIINFVGSESGW